MDNIFSKIVVQHTCIECKCQFESKYMFTEKYDKCSNKSKDKQLL